MREHFYNGEWRYIIRGYLDGMYERLISSIFQEKVAEAGHSFLAAEKDMFGDDEGEAVGVELATSEAKVAQQFEVVGSVLDDPLDNLPG